MNCYLRSFLKLGFFFAIAAGALHAACSCCGEDCSCGDACACETAEAAAQPADEGHPLRGVVQAVMADRQALLVKHEEIPGVMRAMTMMLRVAPFVLNQVEQGDTITAFLHRDEDGTWYLSQVEKTPGS